MKNGIRILRLAFKILLWNSAWLLLPLAISIPFTGTILSYLFVILLLLVAGTFIRAWYLDTISKP